VDELLEHFGIDPYGPNVMRFGLASNLPEDIAKAVLAGLDRNGDARWRRSCEAAATREYLDWAWGINFSMAGQALHKNARIAAGRVQTPVLALVDERCREIENFKPQDYYVPVVVLKDGTTMRWKARVGAQGQPGFDKEGRIVSEALARAIVDKICARSSWRGDEGGRYAARAKAAPWLLLVRASGGSFKDAWYHAGASG